MSYARLIIYNAVGEIFLLRRRAGAWGGGYYFVPGGNILPGNTAADSARHHAEVEAGITAHTLTFTHVVDYHGPGSAHHIFFFSCMDTLSIAHNAAPDKFDSGGWFSLQNLPDNILPAHRHALLLSHQGTFYSIYTTETI